MEPLVEDNVIDINPDPIELKTMEDTIVKDKDIAEPIQSPNFKSGEVGWKWSSNGVAETSEQILNTPTITDATINTATINTATITDLTAHGADMSDISGSFYASSDGINLDLVVTVAKGVITNIT